MKNKIVIIMIFLIIIAFSFGGCGFNGMMQNFYYKLASSNEVYMFENIDELENMEASFKKYGQVQKFSDSYDECLQGLKYKKQYVAKYECDDFEFDIYAYEFETEEQAREYYINFAEDDLDINLWNLYFNSKGTVTSMTINGVNIYRIVYQKNDEKAINTFLSECLSIKMIFIVEDYHHYECIKNSNYKEIE